MDLNSSSCKVTAAMADGTLVAISGSSRQIKRKGSEPDRNWVRT